MVRTAVCIGLGTFGAESGAAEDAMLDVPAPLPRAGERVRALAATFERLGYACVTHEHLSAKDLGVAVREAMNRAGPSDVLVIHIFSHGRVTRSGALHVVGSDGGWDELTEVERWLRNVVDAEDRSPMTLFLLDICYAGGAARLDWQARTSAADERAWVIAACAPEEQAYAGRFTDALTGVLGDLADGRLDIDQSYRHVPISTIAQQIRRDVLRRSAAADGLAQQVTGNLVDISAALPELPFFPNRQRQAESTEIARRTARTRIDAAVQPFLDDLDEALDPAHFLARAAGQGSVSADGVIGCFSGRRRELKILAPWVNLQDDVGLRVVTGSPGAGKSALIGVLVCAAHPALRDSTQSIWEVVEQAPYPNHTMAAVHARERTLGQVVTSIAGQLGISATDPAELIAALPENPVVIVDALDEAIDGPAIMTELLLPLHHAQVRLLVGMRPWDDFAPLRAAADAAGGLHDLDQVHAQVLKRDVENYVVNLLRADRRWDQLRYVGAAQTLASAVATALTQDTANRQWGAFLVAGMFTGHVLHTYAEPIDDLAEAIRLGATVPRTLPELLELDLRTRDTGPWGEPLLAALAHAKGDGMPARTAGHVAAALAGRVAPDVGDVLSAVDGIRFYLRHGAEVDGTTVYRLFHQGLADHLRADVNNAQVLDGLLASLPAHRHWELAEPYLPRHIAKHAVEAGRLAELVADVEFLVAADPASVLPAIDDAPPSPAIDAYRLAAEARTGAPDHGQWRIALAMAALRTGASDLAAAVGGASGSAPQAWQLVAILSLGAEATCVATDEQDGALVAAFGTDIGAGVYVLGADDVPTGELWVEPEPTVAVGVARIAGEPMVVTASSRGRLTRRWFDGHAHQSVGDVPTDTRILHLTEIAGRAAAVTVAASGVTQLRDVRTGASLGRFERVMELSECFELDGRPARLVRDRRTGTAAVTVGGQVRAVLPHDSVSAACAGVAGGTGVIFTGDRGGVVRAWDTAGAPLDEVRLPVPVLGLHATARGELLVKLDHDVAVFRFRLLDREAVRSLVRLRILEPAQSFEGTGMPDVEPLAWRATTVARDPAAPAESAAPVPAPGALMFDFGGETTQGARPVQGDALYADETFLAVAAGRSDADSGPIASRMLLTNVRTLFRIRHGQSLAASLRRAIRDGANQLADRAAAEPGMRDWATSMSAVAVSDRMATIAHVGDSRVYLVHQGRTTLRTSKTTPLTARRHEVELEGQVIQVVQGDRLLLCTAEVPRLVTEQAIAQVMAECEGAGAAARALLRLAQDKGAQDNASVVVGDVVPAVPGRARPFIGGAALLD